MASTETTFLFKDYKRVILHFNKCLACFVMSPKDITTAVGSTDLIDWIITTYRGQYSSCLNSSRVFSTPPLSIFMVGSFNDTFAKGRAEDKATVEQDTVLLNLSLVLQGK
jgi:hypothetical protein